MAQAIERRDIASLKEFYELMARTREVRFEVVTDIFAGRTPWTAAAQSLRNAMENLLALPVDGDKSTIAVTAERSMGIDLGYEIGELHKDIIFLEEGEEALLRHLGKLHPGFWEQVEAASRLLRGMDFTCWITDRDGTTNNYCGRYNSSIQSIYNAVFLTRYAKARVKNAVFITSAPLMNPGIADVSVNPEKTFIYAASKGRECIDLKGVRRAYPIEEAKENLLESFNDHMEALLEDPQYEIFTLIGSGYQRKFGQTTIARQDIAGTISETESQAFLDKIGEVVDHVDPEGDNFRIEDTSLDVEVILTVEGGDGLKDFDKAEGVNYLDETFSLGLAQGPNLVSGDTRSDLPIAEACLAKNPNTWVVFVTEDPALKAAVKELTPNHLIVSTPDVLVTMLGTLA